MPNPKQLPSRANWQPGRNVPRIGKLFKGGKKGEKRPGPDLNHFRLELEPQYEHLRPAFESLYGTEPTEFESVYLVGNTPESIFQPMFREYGNGLKIICDGEQQTLWFNPETGRMDNRPTPCLFPHCQCKMTGFLRLMLGAFMRKTHVYGFFQLDIKSEIEARRISGFMYDLESQMGNLGGCSFIVGRSPQQVLMAELDKKTKQPTGKRINVTKSLVYVTLDGPSMVKLATGLEQSPSLPAPRTEVYIDENGNEVLPNLPPTKRLPAPQNFSSTANGQPPQRIMGRDEYTDGDEEYDESDELVDAVPDDQQEQPSGKRYREVLFDMVTVSKTGNRTLIQTVGNPSGYTYTRKPFRDAGIPCDDWDKKSGKYVLDVQYVGKCEVKRNDQGEHLLLQEIKPVGDIPF